MATPVQRTVHDDVAVLTVDRPDTRNAIDPEVHDALCAAFDAIERDASLRAVVLTGAGGAFVSGGDLRFIQRHPPAETLPLSARMTALLDRIERFDRPVIAAIEGPAFGGGAEIAVACDHRIVHPRARISFRQAAMGLTTGWGASRRLSHLVPRAIAERLLTTAAIVEASEALALGLVDAIAEDPLERALVSAADADKRIRVPNAASIEATFSIDASVSPAAVDAFQRVIAAAYERPDPEVRAIEWREFTARWGSPDHLEALDAFFAKRPPRWGGDAS